MSFHQEYRITPQQSARRRTTETGRAVRFLSSDPSFWDAIRSSWLVESTWQPRVGRLATLASPGLAPAGPLEVVVIVNRTVSHAESPDAAGFVVEKLTGEVLEVERDDLGPAPYVPWPTVKRHAIPKLKLAGIDSSKVDWEDVSDALHQHLDPAYRAAVEDQIQDDEQDDCATCAPRN